VVVDRDTDHRRAAVRREHHPQPVLQSGTNQRVRRRGQGSGSRHATDPTGFRLPHGCPTRHRHRRITRDPPLGGPNYHPRVEDDGGGHTWWAFVDETIWAPRAGIGCYLLAAAIVEPPEMDPART